MLPKPQLGLTIKEVKTKPEKTDQNDKKNYHFMYICQKEIELIDSADDEADQKSEKNGEQDEEEKAEAD